MAVRSNIGKIGSALSKGVRAYQSLNFGPVINSTVNKDISDFSRAADLTNINEPGNFMMGFSKWGGSDKVK